MVARIMSQMPPLDSTQKWRRHCRQPHSLSAQSATMNGGAEGTAIPALEGRTYQLARTVEPIKELESKLKRCRVTVCGRFEESTTPECDCAGQPFLLTAIPVTNDWPASPALRTMSLHWE